MLMILCTANMAYMRKVEAIQKSFDTLKTSWRDRDLEAPRCFVPKM